MGFLQPSRLLLLVILGVSLVLACDIAPCLNMNQLQANMPRHPSIHQKCKFYRNVVTCLKQRGCQSVPREFQAALSICNSRTHHAIIRRHLLLGVLP